jgi:SAM-dependent methyltransferase
MSRSFRRPLFRSFFAVAVLTAISVSGQESQTKKDVPYVPTPQAVVDEMLRLAAVTKNDVVYDLGSGDGRIVITAAKKYGARGVGVDIDPERVKEANANALQAGVTDRVKFLQQDLFATDLKGASVVTLYLLPAVNLKLRPKLWAELKPGTRVVSHSFDMGDWKPENTVEIQGSKIYYWVIPAKAPKD